MLKPSHYRERRSCSRVLLELPLDYQSIGTSNTYGGIAVDGSETGLFLQSRRHIPVGTQLEVSVLFAEEFELANFKAVAKIVRKIDMCNGQKDYGYGLTFLQVDEEDIRKFSRLLINHRCELDGGSSGSSLIADSGVFSNILGWQPKKEKKPFLRFLLNLLKIR